MKISQLIIELREMRMRWGDITVKVYDRKFEAFSKVGGVIMAEYDDGLPICAICDRDFIRAYTQ